METIKLISKISVTVILLFINLTCSSSLVNIAESKKQLRKYYETGQYDADVKKIIRDAITDVKSLDLDKNSTVIFDVDDTAISNYEFSKELDFGNNDLLWDEFMDKASAPAIPSVKEFYDFLIDRRIKIVFLTGRSYGHYDATLKNLINAGYTKFDTLIVKSEKMINTASADYKNIERFILTERGYKIIACIGDQESDFTGENTGIKIKLPNYLYQVE